MILIKKMLEVVFWVVVIFVKEVKKAKEVKIVKEMKRRDGS